MSAFDLKARFEIIHTQIEALTILTEKPQCAESEWLKALTQDLGGYIETTEVE